MEIEKAVAMVTIAFISWIAYANGDQNAGAMAIGAIAGFVGGVSVAKK